MKRKKIASNLILVGIALGAAGLIIANRKVLKKAIDDSCMNFKNCCKNSKDQKDE